MLLLLPVLLQRVTAPAVAAASTGPLVDWRRALHRAPEPAFAEHASTALVRRALGALGLPEIALPTTTGAAFLVPGTRPGPRVLVRADLDALPVTEATGLPFASERPGLMHACGHDAHTAIVLGLGHRLATAPPDRGSVLLLFQPAEETLAGARAVLGLGLDGARDGPTLLDAHAVDAVLGAHVTPMLPTGSFGIRSGTLLAGAVGYVVHVAGRGGHGALPRTRATADALAAAAAAVPVLRGALRELASVDGVAAQHAVPLPAVTVCELHAGTAPNVTSETARLTGSLRHVGPVAPAWERLGAQLAAHATEHGVQVTLQRTAATPPVVNHPAACAAVAAALIERFSMAALRWLPSALPTSDDFAELAARRPGCYLLLGAARPDRTTRVAHSPRFDVDEAALAVGVDTLDAAARALLARPPTGRTPAPSRAPRAGVTG